MRYLMILITLISVTYGQLIIKYEVNKLGKMPVGDLSEMMRYFYSAFTNVGILSGLLAAVIAAVSWIGAMSYSELSSIYPILSLNFVIVPLCSVLLFGENMNVMKALGVIVILFGVFMVTKGGN